MKKMTSKELDNLCEDLHIIFKKMVKKGEMSQNELYKELMYICYTYLDNDDFSGFNNYFHHIPLSYLVGDMLSDLNSDTEYATISSSIAIKLPKYANLSFKASDSENNLADRELDKLLHVFKNSKNPSQCKND